MSLKRKGFHTHNCLKSKHQQVLTSMPKHPAEVAISILAEIIQLNRINKGAITSSMPVDPNLSSDLYINPVCKIPVSKSSAKHVVEYEGERVYFCCDGCHASFNEEPSAYI